MISKAIHREQTNQCASAGRQCTQGFHRRLASAPPKRSCHRALACIQAKATSHWVLTQDNTDASMTIQPVQLTQEGVLAQRTKDTELKEELDHACATIADIRKDVEALKEDSNALDEDVDVLKDMYYEAEARRQRAETDLKELQVIVKGLVQDKADQEQQLKAQQASAVKVINETSLLDGPLNALGRHARSVVVVAGASGSLRRFVMDTNQADANPSMAKLLEMCARSHRPWLLQHALLEAVMTLAKEMVSDVDVQQRQLDPAHARYMFLEDKPVEPDYYMSQARDSVLSKLKELGLGTRLESDLNARLPDLALSAVQVAVLCRGYGANQLRYELLFPLVKGTWQEDTMQAPSERVHDGRTEAMLACVRPGVVSQRRDTWRETGSRQIWEQADVIIKAEVERVSTIE